MPTSLYALLHETPQGAFVSYIYRERACALYAADNAARQTAADMRTADAASGCAHVGSGIYAVRLQDRGGRAVLSIVHTPSGEIDPSFRWTVLEREVVEQTLASLAQRTGTAA